MKDKLLNKTLYHFDFKAHKKRIWGKILDARKENYVIFAGHNPEGYRVFEHAKSDIQRWMDDKKIFLKGDDRT